MVYSQSNQTQSSDLSSNGFLCPTLQPCPRALFGAFVGRARAKLNICRSITVALPLAASWNYHMVKRWEGTINKDDGFFS